MSSNVPPLPPRFKYLADYRQFFSLEEMAELPGYVEDAPAQKGDFERGIGWYEFSDAVPCGRSSCHQKHNAGYLIQLKNGAVIRVGNRCGSDFAGSDFATFLRRVDNQKRQQARAAWLSNFADKLPGIEARIEALMSGPFGITATKNRVATFLSRVPKFLRLELHHRSLKNNYRIAKARPMTRSERELEGVRQRRALKPEECFVDEVVGALQGLSALTDSPTALFDNHVAKPLRQLKLAMAGDNKIKQAKLSADLAEVEPALEKITAQLETARRFFTAENFANFQHLARNDSQLRELQEFRWHF